MFNVLTALAMGIVIFAITVGVGSVVLAKFGGSIAACADIGVSTYTYNYSLATPQCSNDTDTTDGNYVPPEAAYTTTQALLGDLGTTGLAGWTAAIIALAVGLLFIGALMGKRKY